MALEMQPSFDSIDSAYLLVVAAQKSAGIQAGVYIKEWADSTVRRFEGHQKAVME